MKTYQGEMKYFVVPRRMVGRMGGAVLVCLLNSFGLIHAQDVTPPGILSAVSDCETYRFVQVAYDEPVFVMTALDPFNYLVAWNAGGNLDVVLGVTQEDASGEVFNLELGQPLQQGVQYTLEVFAILDLAGNESGLIQHPIQICPIPEPGTLALMGVGAALLGVWSRRDWNHRLPD